MKQNRILSWESHLIERAAAGDSVAFELLSDLYRPTLTTLAMRMLRNSDDAQDVVQDTLLKALKAMNDFDSSRPLKPWLSRICTNCCVDLIRHRQRDGESLDDHEYMLCDERSDVAAAATQSVESREVHAAIGRLPDRYREILVMRHFNHMEVNEIADRLDKPEGTIKSWLFRARAMLRKDLQMVAG